MNSSHQGTFKNGVLSAFPLRETIGFTGFLGTFQDTAVAHKKHSYHILTSEGVKFSVSMGKILL